ncbi:deoxyribonuclease ii [Anaeramoeba flamelloides]|uniref:Deoxyribonuclease ii n=1 Tax=Anaeramoeba flamelloides TaxID=1746091 RepID=A0AAV7ZXN1_9EUKA|nr:deoxyribonuclease ii [Anaeramoeba flamelloides]KAJ6254851.1 deoxyribonuclease ii [Anaeramoeba flamelloides]
MTIKIFFVSLVFLTLVFGQSPSCLDESGNFVDWWIIYKYPVNSGADAEGYGYAYGDANSPTIVPTGKRVDQNLDGALGSTFKQAWNNKGSSSVGWLFYNDQIESELDTTSMAHSKGAVIWDEQTAAWIIHSLPKFPPPTSHPYSIPDSGDVYGQTFFCVSMNFKDVDDIGLSLRYRRALTFDYNFPSSYVSSLPNIHKTIYDDYIDGPITLTQHFSTIKNVDFVSFAKTKEWATDLGLTIYEDLVQPELGIDAAWQTWTNGAGGKQPSFCKSNGYEWDSVNILYVQIDDSITWKQTKDHAKWGVSLTPGRDYVCFSGINRMDSQMSRGGGAVCLKHDGIYNSFKGFIQERDYC